MKVYKSIMYGLLALSATAIAADEQPDSKSVAIKARQIVPMSSAPIENGLILVQGGKIRGIGTDVTIPDGAVVIDAGDGWVLPGLIQTNTTLGTSERGRGSDSDETSSPNTAEMQIVDGVNPFAKSIQYARMGGITSILATPGKRNVIGGQMAVLKLWGKTVTDMTLKAPAGLKLSLGESPKDTYGSKSRLPGTRMGSAFVIRKAFMDAQDYLARWQSYEKKTEKGEEGTKPSRDLKLEPLAAALKGEMPVFVECYRADDIMTALRLIDEFKLKAVLVGCAEGHKIPGEIARRSIPVVVSPFGVGPRAMETQDVRMENAAILSEAGVKITIRADESSGIGNIRELPLLAAFAVKSGLDRTEALRAITLNAAEVMGVADRIGSLETGKDADLVIFSGDPFHYRTRVQRVMINGETVFTR